jgi:hypothetical protein
MSHFAEIYATLVHRFYGMCQLYFFMNIYIYIYIYIYNTKKETNIPNRKKCSVGNSVVPVMAKIFTAI